MTNIQVEDLTDVKKKVVFEIPADRIQEMMDSQYRDLKKTVQIKGFRKGKVPLDLVRSFFKKQVKADTGRTNARTWWHPTVAPAPKKIAASPFVSYRRVLCQNTFLTFGRPSIEPNR